MKQIILTFITNFISQTFLMQNVTVFFTQKMAVEVKQNNICTLPVCMIQIHFQAIHDVGHSKCWRPRDSCSTVDQD